MSLKKKLHISDLFMHTIHQDGVNAYHEDLGRTSWDLLCA